MVGQNINYIPIPRDELRHTCVISRVIWPTLHLLPRILFVSFVAQKAYHGYTGFFHDFIYMYSVVEVDIEYAVKQAGEDHTVTCTGTGDSTIDLIWLKLDNSSKVLDQQVGKFVNGKISASLTFSSMRVEDSGNYTCSASFDGNTTITVDTRIEVIGEQTTER